MRLYLIRHAIAVASGSGAVRMDQERALTEVGAKKMRKHALALKEMGVTFDVVLTSPLIRAVQTAEIIGDILDCRDRIQRCEALAPGCELDAVAEVLAEHRAVGSVALVGHSPDLEGIATAILGGGSGGEILFRKGGICRIDVSELAPRLTGDLIWHLTPKQLRLIAQ